MAENTKGNAESGAANNNKAVGPEGGFSAYDLKELEKFTNLAISRKNQLQKEGNRIEQMSSCGHWYDAKVPDSDKCWYNFVSLTTCTDKKIINGKIKKYKDFYEELQRAVNDLRRAAKEDNVDADEILKLYDNLSKMIEEAESGKKATNSSTLYKIHTEFLQRQEPLENMIKRVECVALRQQLKQVTNAWKNALQEITELKHEMQEIREDNQEMKEQLDSLTTVNQGMAENQKVLLQQNKLISDMLRQLLDNQ